jgi:acetyl-CoA carboxylase biotin carboxyl carrier protein
MADALHYIATDLPDLLRLVQSSDVRELEIREGEVHLRLHRADSLDGEEVVVEAAEIEQLSRAEPLDVEVTAPLVGTFYRAAEPESPPLVDEGSVVEESTIVGIIEALNVLNPVQAGCRGVVTSVLATDGQPVQYGQPLFEVNVGG